MFMCRVLVGSYTQGQSHYHLPPSRDGGNILYDSCVNDIHDPSIFVVFDKQQIYPILSPTLKTFTLVRQLVLQFCLARKNGCPLPVLPQEKVSRHPLAMFQVSSLVLQQCPQGWVLRVHPMSPHPPSHLQGLPKTFTQSLFLVLEHSDLQLCRFLLQLVTQQYQQHH